MLLKCSLFKVREDHQECNALQQLHSAHLPSTVEKRGFKKVCCYFSCCHLREKMLICMGFYLEFQKIYSLNQNQNPPQVHLPRNQPQSTLLVSASPHTRETLKKPKTTKTHCLLWADYATGNKEWTRCLLSSLRTVRWLSFYPQMVLSNKRHFANSAPHKNTLLYSSRKPPDRLFLTIYTNYIYLYKRWAKQQPLQKDQKYKSCCHFLAVLLAKVRAVPFQMLLLVCFYKYVNNIKTNSIKNF